MTVVTVATGPGSILAEIAEDVLLATPRAECKRDYPAQLLIFSSLATFECIEVDTGNRRWKDRRGNYGPGQILMVEDVILVQAESGDVAMVEVNPDKLVELGRLPALSDQTWNNLCLYDHFLLVRNSVEAVCYELPLKTAPQATEAMR